MAPIPDTDPIDTEEVLLNGLVDMAALGTRTRTTQRTAQHFLETLPPGSRSAHSSLRNRVTAVRVVVLTVSLELAQELQEVTEPRGVTEHTRTVFSRRKSKKKKILAYVNRSHEVEAVPCKEGIFLALILQHRVHPPFLEFMLTLYPIGDEERDQGKSMHHHMPSPRHRRT
jgi:hypothetical protein